MAVAWFLFAVLVPPLAAGLSSHFLAEDDPDPVLIILANALMPGSGLAIARRSFLEVTLGVLLAQVSMVISGGPVLGYLVPIAVIGGMWGSIYTPYNPLTAQGLPPSMRNSQSVQEISAPRSTTPLMEQVGGMSRINKEPEESDDQGYSVSIRCTECGAEVSVPVLHRAAQCPFCSSYHLVVGHDDVLHVAIPENVQSDHELREKLLEYYRYRYYLKLYQRHVAPLERQATVAGPQGGLAVQQDVAMAAEAAERRVSARADAWMEKLRSKFDLQQTQRFLSPYYHSMGTLYQAAFGRDPQSKDKRLSFSTANLETALAAQDKIDLPEMGKLSYLKALQPVEALPEDSRVLPNELPTEIITEAHTNLKRKKIDRSIESIRVGSVFSEEIRAVVWRPWIVASVMADGHRETFLVEGASGSITGSGNFVNEDLFGRLGRPREDATLRFQPMECPTCGFEFRYEIDAQLHFCSNCYRVFKATPQGKQEIGYDHEEQSKGEELIPFWRFPLHIKTGDGKLLTDFAHFKDGIDGTLDQIGDKAQTGQDFLWIPATRCINPRLTRTALSALLLHTLRNPPRLRKGRFPLDMKVQPWPVVLNEVEARTFAPLLLAEIFSPRDIARVHVHQVENWIFDATLGSKGHLSYLSVPSDLTASFRAYLGRSRVAGLPSKD